MEEPIKTPAAEAPAAPAPEAPAAKPEEAKKPDGTVLLSVTVDGQTTDERLLFNTPALLEKLTALPDGATVKIVGNGPDGPESTIFEGTKADAVKAMEQAVVPYKNIGLEFRKLAQFLVDHSTLKAVGVHGICVADDGSDAAFGFVATATCSQAQAVEFVNCGDANLNEFVAKAKLDVPGRGGVPEKGTIVAPTPDEIKNLG